jgi:hypothetical protein
VAEVSVDAEGEVRLERVVCADQHPQRNQAGLRTDLKVARRSDTRSEGCSQAAK